MNTLVRAVGALEKVHVTVRAADVELEVEALDVLRDMALALAVVAAHATDPDTVHPGQVLVNLLHYYVIA